MDRAKQFVQALPITLPTVPPERRTTATPIPTRAVPRATAEVRRPRTTTVPRLVPTVAAPSGGSARTPTTEERAPTAVYYENCAAARRAGAAPIRAGEPGYRPGLDRDRDGVACDH
ncbi:excalibur calcium-binding domain-containing protein [Pseudonocardia thermophila]|jgi:Excalibur calcium-binding domain.|nr:excalibur calcium-binding domain-containing protein [Pseudonocardia thermophila]